MAEERDGWKTMEANLNRDITQAFRELGARWQSIFAQEQLRVVNLFARFIFL